MPAAAVLFDLDGTLLDTLRDVAEAANQTLSECNFAPHALKEYRFLLGGGLRNLFRAALPPEESTEETVDHCVRVFDDAYRAAWNVHTRPYPGIPELVAELAARGVTQAVLSNKPHEFTRLCIEEFFGGATTEHSGSETSGIGPFAFVAGQRTGVPVKPDPTSALEIANQLSIPPADWLYVGDTSIDMETANRAGMRPIGVSWGFRDRQELIDAGAETVVDEPSQLATFF
ncbi:MAG: HAD family hydrolase [Planctomycetota bacterium]|nr:MAG: HAD family hydrolase [Planctomycetota bacterium]REK19982.1 MAG: HAD family hydrolase [Planctomycetota bacterium]REK27549.1 MAG: HAD family hydrolase [Planctomycetota bacterium]